MSSILQPKYKMREYRIHIGMKARCYNTNNVVYKYYGARGIKVSDRWLGKDGFNNFLIDMGKCPTTKHSLDRKNPDGDYEPSNCRWATSTVQSWNKRKSINNISGFMGVYPNTNNKITKNGWFSKIKLPDETFYLGVFTTPEEAALQYDRAVIFFRGNDGITNII